MGSADQVNNSDSHSPGRKLYSGTPAAQLKKSLAFEDDYVPTAVVKIIEKCRANGGLMIDLSQQGLTEIPEAILTLQSLENLYLEGNHISYLPEDFFDYLPNLKWLDLRHNQLMYLPTAHLNKHRCLKTLLLQGNKLRTLPLELGMIPCLKGLSLSENPLEYPSSRIIALGTDELLRYLRECWLTKSQGKDVKVSELDAMTQLSIRDNDDSGASSTEEELQLPRQPTTSPAPHVGVDDDLGVQPRPAELHRPVSYYQIKQRHLEKILKAGASGKVSVEKNEKMASPVRRKSSSKSEISIKTRHPVITPYPEPPPISYMVEKGEKEQRMKRIKEIKEKQDTILQRRKNYEALKDFRQDTKSLQMKKYRQRLKRGEDYGDTVEEAPYGYEKDFSKVRNKEDLIKHEVRLAHEKMSRPMSPRTLERMELERARMDRELEKKVKIHTESMLERRRQSRGTAGEEMEAAKREMEIGLQLERELQQRRKELQYRFQAFTGDVPP